MKTETRLLSEGCHNGDRFHPTSPPIYQTATFIQEDPDQFGAYDYSRSGNPTRSVLDEQLALLEGATFAHSFNSGMAALACVFQLVRSGQKILAGRDLYGGTYRILTTLVSRRGIQACFAPSENLSAFLSAIYEERPRLVIVESPSNPLLNITDLREVAKACREVDALLVVDNSLMSPCLQKPLELGADLVVHSATKALSGHADLTAGVVCGRDADIGREIKFIQNAEGSALGPFDSWLLIRSLKTLHLRVREQQASAQILAQLLLKSPSVRSIYYPGLKTHPGRAVHFAQARGPGNVISFETGSYEASKALVRELKIFGISVSFGSIHSTVSLPCRMSHASIPEKKRKEKGLPEDLVRLSIGAEDVDDLAQDLTRALQAAEEVLFAGQERKLLAAGNV